MGERIILHSDLNCFYASVEMMLHPELKGRAVAVCGSTESRHGIVLAKSYPAKRCGVKTGMVNWEAKCCCPDLIMVPPHYDQYLKYSRLVHAIYYRFTDLVEPYGMDECWLDVTGSRKVLGSGLEIAEAIRRSVREELGLTVSIGVSFNKIFAKLGSDMKKPDAITVISKADFKNLVWPLPVEELLYVGPATKRRLMDRGITTIGQVAALPVKTLECWLGKNGVDLWYYASGYDASRVMHKDFVSPVKSIGHGITCVADLATEEERWKVLLELAQDVGRRLRLHQLAAMGVHVSARGSDLGVRQFQKRFNLATRSPYLLAQAGRQLLQERWPADKLVRALSIRGIDLVPQGRPQQPDVFTDVEHLVRRDKLETAVEEVRERFGKSAVRAAVLLGDLKMPEDGRDKVRMPGMMYK